MYIRTVMEEKASHAFRSTQESFVHENMFFPQKLQNDLCKVKKPKALRGIPVFIVSL